MNLYSRLLRLYRTNMLKTPLEDFTTEIFAGILDKYPEIGKAFAQRILLLEGDKYDYSTQVCFPTTDPQYPDCRVDLVVRTDESVCFVECKVEASEGRYQLLRYSLVLDQLAVEKKTLLRYCTKYYDLKVGQSHDFRQFRWADVYRFLSEWRNCDIVNHFLEFLNEHNMSDNMDFNVSDLMTMQGINPVVQKMDRYLEKIRQVFKFHFPLARIKESGKLGQIKVWSRFVFIAEQIFGAGYSEFGVGFSFNDVPELRVWLWCEEKNPQTKSFREALQDSDLENNGENWVAVSRALSDFVSSYDMEQDIEVWFASAFEQLKDFKSKHPELNWQI